MGGFRPDWRLPNTHNGRHEHGSLGARWTLNVQARDDLRNVAIVAHVDHGKTTLVDQMLWQTGAFRANQDVADRVMDSMDLEREKGITILAKNTAIRYGDDAAVTINIVDTPGHADFGGEVERALSMVDGVLLLVDASEGPLPQTRFVLRKTLEAKLPVILVINKVDRPDARIAEVVHDVEELFLDLDAAIDQLDFPTVYCVSREGRASMERPADGAGLPTDSPWRRCSTCSSSASRLRRTTPTMPLQALVTNLDASPYVGRLALCRVRSGTLRKGSTVAWCRADGTIERARIAELYTTQALDRVPADSAGPGEIVAVAGIAEITIGETLADPDDPVRCPVIHDRRPEPVDDDRDQHVAARRPGRLATDRPARQEPPRRRARRQRQHPRPADRASRHLGGPGPRRVAARRARRDDAARGLRAHRRQADRAHREVDGVVHEPVDRVTDRRPRGVPRRDHPAARPAQGPDGADRQPRLGLDPPRLPRAGAGPHRLPHRAAHRDPGHGAAAPRVRALRAVGRARSAPAPRGSLVADRLGSDDRRTRCCRCRIAASSSSVPPSRSTRG